MATRSQIGGRAAEIVGRRSEMDVLDRLIEDVRAGESRTLVVRGEPGVGKTALLDYIVEQASGFRIARAAGVQSEMELAFAALHQLLAPILDRLERLPAPQRDALRTAFGLSPGLPPDPFLVALAVLSLLSAVAEEQPLICLVDDEQWLDRASAQVLAFVARRLEAESVGVVFAARGTSDALTGLPELVVEGLREGDARALLASVLTWPLDARVRDQILSETRGVETIRAANAGSVVIPTSRRRSGWRPPRTESRPRVTTLRSWNFRRWSTASGLRSWPIRSRRSRSARDC
jgi:hypothetical protein